MYCNFCGNFISERSNFCEKCGNKLIEPKSTGKEVAISKKIIGFYLLWFLVHFVLLIVNWDSGKSAYFWPFEEYSHLHHYDFTEFLIYTLVPLFGIIIWEIFNLNDNKLTEKAEQSQYVFAGFWKRFLSYLLDLPILYMIGLVIGILEHLLFLGNPTLEAILIFPGNFQGLIIGWLYFALMERGENQGTFGKQILNIKVTGLDGERISFGRATGRFFGKIISFIPLFIGFLMIPFTSKKQGLHDILANCLVLSEK